MTTATTTPASDARAGRKPVPTEYVGVWVFFIFTALVCWRMAMVMNATTWGAMALAAVAGYVGADFVSGMVHWGFDTWGSPNTPVLGKTFIIPFRLHHSDEKEMTLHGFIATNGHNCLVTSPVLAGSLLLDATTPLGAGLVTLLFSLCFGTFLTNQFHKWAHEDDVGPFVSFLQRSRLILGKPNHDQHHRRPYDTHYCITTGWLNAPLSALRFYRGLEWVITRVTGVKPRINDLSQA